jgi:hypothetical protein
MKFRLTDADPRHLAAAAIVALAAGFVLFFAAGYCVIWRIGGYWAWAGCAIGFVLLCAGGVAMGREKQDADDADEAGA